MYFKLRTLADLSVKHVRILCSKTTFVHYFLLIDYTLVEHYKAEDTVRCCRHRSLLTGSPKLRRTLFHASPVHMNGWRVASLIKVTAPLR
jgi:hypothetical protein